MRHLRVPLLVVLSLVGLYLHIEYSGWVLFIAILLVLA